MSKQSGPQAGLSGVARVEANGHEADQRSFQDK